MFLWALKILPLFKFLRKHWRIVLIIASVIGILGFLGYVYHKGGSDREDKLVTEAIKEKVKEREKLDEIRNAPIDTDTVIDRLRSGTF